MKTETPALPKKPHSLTLENREHGLISGVEKVISSNETSLNLQTSGGGLSVTGSGLKINKFDVDSGVLVFDGTVNAVKYSGAKVPFLKRLFS